MFRSKIKSYCKINLFLKVLNKLKNNYHTIVTLVTFSELHDLIFISKIEKSRDVISFTGKYKKGINKKKNTITKLLHILRKNKLMRNNFFRINIQKNIPHGSGLGGGSSNAAFLLKYLNFKLKFKLTKKNINKIAKQIGFDAPICLEKRNSFITGYKNEIIRLKKNFKLNLIIVYPGIVCSTKKIYNKNKIRSKRPNFPINFKNNLRLIEYLKRENNDLEKAAISIYPKINEIINYIKSQKGCHFSRISGSGSACIGIFSNMKQAIRAQKRIKFKYPNYWCAVSKTI